jgi:hypothetical protein
MNVRAKFRCISVTEYSLDPDPDGMKQYRFQPMYSPDIPEDRQYSKYTPVGSLEISVTNPSVEFVVGTDYYLDFTEVKNEKEAA